ncbi:ABC transporter ATP-binding protein [Streptococcus sp. DD13]|uniref:ABC transporter ATP-binding protein n=1 Tax=Streptococcus sp. DD13 TaxID=1777881 RepID=UPI00079AE25D|nr:ABC transporter ATP-binding protein [Streptococcus sp. DD13]KXT78138.1 Lipid A export ATP-binding/permease protein MsbA [Streptococcus sp. DD13]
MLKIFKRLTRKEWFQILVSVLFVCVEVWSNLKVPDYMSEVTTLLNTPDTTVAQIMGPGWKMIGFSFLSFLSAVLVGLIASRVAASFTTRLRGDIFDQVMDYSDAEIKRFSIPSLLTRTTNDLTQLQILITTGLQVVTMGPIMAFWALTKIWGESSEWTMSLGVAALIVIVLLAVLLGVAFPRQSKVQEMTDNLNAVTRETLSGIRVVRAYNAEDYQDAKYSKVNQDMTRLNLFIFRLMSLMNPVMTLVSSGLTLAVYWIGGYLINNVSLQTASQTALAQSMQERVTIFSDMVVFSSYGMQVILGFMLMAAVFMILPRALVSSRRINEVLDLKPSVLFPEETQKQSNGNVGEIEFHDVSFRYARESADVIEHVHFKAKAGETVAFIGSTGSGKSTLISLLPRFYDPTGGWIKLDGIKIQDYSENDLNAKIGYIPQKPVLYSGTIRSNLDFGDSSESPLSDEAMWEALELAQAKEFVDSKEAGLDAEVAQGGTNFSGGQRQRLAIARALARKPEVLIFDDSFSALDYKTDKQLRHDLAEKTAQTTKLIVAQRISTIMDADQILVLEEGKVVGQGRHEELLKTNRVYQEIAYSQLSQEELENGK